jgi:uncharacterized protein YjbI with pentapeptide repeats
MEEWFLSEQQKRQKRQKIKQYGVTILVVSIILVVAIALIIIGYRFDWTGFNGTNKSGKTLWDWLQLLIIPVVLAFAGYAINLTISRGEQAATEQRAQSEREAADKRAKTDRDIALDNQREAALKDYIDKMSDLILNGKLLESQEDAPIRKIARVRTKDLLRRLDDDRWKKQYRRRKADRDEKFLMKLNVERKVSIIIFLHEYGLVDKDSSIVFLKGTDLREANFRGADLRGINLSGTFMFLSSLDSADLSEADLRSADLSGADLSGANLSGADLSRANIQEAFLGEANLGNANLSGAHLNGAALSNAYLGGADLSGADLRGATMYDTKLIGANLSGADLNGAEVTPEQLSKAKSLKGATMTNGDVYE